MKKFYITSIFVAVIALVLGPTLSVLTQNTTANTARPQLTAEQQKCIDEARTQSDAIKTANQNFNTAIKSALQIRQDAMRTAMDAFNAGAKDAVEVKNTAIKAAQDAFNKAVATAVETRQNVIRGLVDNKNQVEREKAMQEANNAYENNPAVKKARPIYEAVIRAANEKFDANPQVKKLKPIYESAVKSASDAYENNTTVKQATEQFKKSIEKEQNNIVKKCTRVSFGQRIRNFFANIFGRGK